MYSDIKNIRQIRVILTEILIILVNEHKIGNISVNITQICLIFFISESIFLRTRQEYFHNFLYFLYDLQKNCVCNQFCDRFSPVWSISPLILLGFVWYFVGLNIYFYEFARNIYIILGILSIILKNTHRFNTRGWRISLHQNPYEYRYWF